MPESMDTRRGSAFEDEPLLDMDTSALRAYGAALNAFNSGNWDAAIISCGKAMEEIAKAQLPYNERNGALGHLLERLPKHLKLDQPMAELAVAVKDSKGLGGHFDLERHTSEEIAKATLSLLESYINYIYLFRAKVERLIELVENADSTRSRSAPPEPEREQRPPEPAKQPVARQPVVQTRPDQDVDESPFDAFNKRDPYDIRSAHWNIGEKDD